MPDRDQRHAERRGRTRSRSQSPARRREEKGQRRPRSYSRSASRSPRRTRERSRSRSRRRSSSRSRYSRKKRDRRSRSRSKSRSRSRSNSRSRSRRRGRRSSSSSSSDRSDRHRKNRKSKRSHKGDKNSDKKERRKDKKNKKRAEKGSVTSQWGKYGIISETSLYDKEAEFRTWLVEERKLNPETLSKDLTKKEFARFVEDYNTATLPHEKYYNMASYDRRMSSLRNGETLPYVEDTYDLNADLAAHSSSHKRISTSKDTYMSKEQLQELRKVQAERNQVAKMKLMGMEIGQSFGVRMDGSMFDD